MCVEGRGQVDKKEANQQTERANPVETDPRITYLVRHRPVEAVPVRLHLQYPVPQRAQHACQGLHLHLAGAVLGCCWVYRLIVGLVLFVCTYA